MHLPVLITNPRSHAVATNGSILHDIAKDFPQARFLSVEDFTRLPDKIRELGQSGVTTFFVEGGDGTLEGVMSAYLAARDAFSEAASFAVLPGGSTNLAYRILGLQRAKHDDVAKRLSQVISGQSGLRYDQHQALSVSAASLEIPVVGFLLSTGSLARAMLYTQQNLHGEGRRGSLAVATAIAQIGLWPEKAMDHDGEPVIRSSVFEEVTGPADQPAREHAFSIMTTLPRLSLRLNPFWNRGDHPIGFTYGQWPITNLRRGVLKLLFGATGTQLAKHGLTSTGLAEISFRSEDPVIVDGEVLPRPDDFIYHVKPSPSLRFLR